jgi:hypothetical protein
MQIHVIPLDAWANIMVFIDDQDLTNTFHVLCDSGVLNVDERERLNAFWILMSLARIRMKEQETPSLVPDGREYAKSFAILREMGMHKETAEHILRQGDGTLKSAFEILGW